MEVGGHRHTPAALSQGTPTRNQWTRGWTDSRPGLEAVKSEKYLPLSRIEAQFPGRPSHSLGTVQTDLAWFQICYYKVYFTIFYFMHI